ncbi:MAG TPA: hypothetical protein VD866_29975 [Urbifossiella sp.]|nr:hypothetical protein [Urbifossiella sp.]
MTPTAGAPPTDNGFGAWLRAYDWPGPDDGEASILAVRAAFAAGVAAERRAYSATPPDCAGFYWLREWVEIDGLADFRGPVVVEVQWWPDGPFPPLVAWTGGGSRDLADIDLRSLWCRVREPLPEGWAPSRPTSTGRTRAVSTSVSRHQ